MSKKRGILKLENLKVERQHSFLEYVFGGCEVDLSIAIDFTLSNGDPRHRESLHFFDLYLHLPPGTISGFLGVQVGQRYLENATF